MINVRTQAGGIGAGTYQFSLEGPSELRTYGSKTIIAVALLLALTLISDLCGKTQKLIGCSFGADA